MKFGSILIAITLVATSAAFTTVEPRLPFSRVSNARQFMFSGAGSGGAMEENPEQMKMIEQTAKAMGMTVEEYQLGVSARVRLTNNMDSARVVGGDGSKVSVERDANNPPKHLQVTITEAGKALGKDAVSKALVGAFKSSSEEARAKRAEYQKDMMTFISEEMKKRGP
jgi:hypothetical protein